MFCGIPRCAASSGEIWFEQVRVAHQPEPDRRRRRAEQLVQLGGDPLARQVDDQPGPCLDPGQRGRLDPEVEGRGEPDRPDHPERVLLEAFPGFADRSQHPVVDIEDAAVGVDERRRVTRSGPPGHRVDREVAARQIDLDRVAELDPERPPEVVVVVIGPEGRDLEDLARLPDRDGPEAVLVDGARKELDQAFGACVRREVPIGREPVEGQVAQRAADDVGRVTGRPERPEQAIDGGRDRVPDDDRTPRQLRPRNRYERHASLCSSARYGVNSE